MSSVLTLGGNNRTIDVRGYPTFSAAVAALSQSDLGYGYGRIYVPAGVYDATTTPAVDAMTLTSNSITFEGDGPASTWIKFNQANQDLFTVTSSDFCIFRNMRIQGAGSSGTGRCFSLKSSSYMLFDNLWLDLFPSWGVDFNDSAGDCVANEFRKVRVTQNVGNGALRLGPSGSAKCFGTKFYTCLIKPTGGHCVDTVWSQKSGFYGCTFESESDVNMVYAAGLTTGLTLDDCWFETPAATSSNWFIHIASGTHPGWNIDRCHFARTNSGITGARIFNSLGALKHCKIGSLTAQTGGIPAGTDDFVLAAGDECSFIGEGKTVKTDGVSNPQNMTISEGLGCLITRLGGWRLRLPVIAGATRDALNDIADGDVVMNATTNHYEGFRTSAWRDLSTAP